jgi:PAS domain S-box-containing protein
MTLEKDININKEYHFLRGGGEMGTLTRNFDWATTPIGIPTLWPQSLRTTIAMILSSRFPMFLWWGEELVQFYNDAYRPSLGNNGKHPLALGQKAEDCWPEVWDIIYPLIQQVQTTGEATWSEDQLIPIYRNGKMEDVYWTFGYSPIKGESEKVEGVLVVCNETTAKVQMVKKLIENERDLRLIISQTPTGICILSGKALQVEVVNDIFLEILGKQREELIGKNYWEVVPERRPFYEPILHEVFKSGNAFRGKEHEITLTRDGREENIFINFVYEPMINGEGLVEKVMIMVIEVTDQVIAHKKLEQSEERFQSAVAAVQGILWTNNAIGEMEGEQPGWAGLTGQCYEEYQGYGWSKAVHPEDAQPTIDAWNKAVQEHKTFNFEHRVLMQNKKWGHFSVRAIPLINTDGSIREWVGVHINITEQRQTEQALRESERNLRATILQAPVAMCIFKGSNHVLELANERMYELWGKSAGELLGKPIFEGLPETKNQGFESLLNNVYNTGEAVSACGMPITLPRNEKLKLIYVNLLYEAYREADGSVSGILAVATDITEQVIARHQIEEVVSNRTKELAEVNNNLEKSNAELAQFAYIASHDLQEPLRKISTFAQMLEHSLGNVDERSRNYLTKINNSSSRMITLIRDILSYSQLSTENEIFEQVDLQKIVEGALTDFELLIEQKGASVHYKNLPVIEAIPLQISQLFGNLLSNALKFSNGDVKPVVNITANLLSEQAIEENPMLDNSKIYYLIEFRDNGIGFKQEYADQIFHIFQRLHRKTEYAGTGIGLAMCKKITQNHHGDIYASASSETGAVFNVILPQTQVS